MAVSPNETQPNAETAGKIHGLERSALSPAPIVDPVTSVIKDPENAQIDLDQLAICLSTLCRFFGHGDKWISVASHSRNVCREVQDALRDDDRFTDREKAEIALVALMHDGRVAYIGDTTRPVMDYYRKHCPEFIPVREALAARIDGSVFRSVGVSDIPSEGMAIIEEANSRVSRVEAMHIGVIPNDMNDEDRKLAQRIEADRPVFGDDAAHFVDMANQLVEQVSVEASHNLAQSEKRTARRIHRLERPSVAPVPVVDIVANVISDPENAKIDITRAAICLSHLRRFSGHGDRWISVAAHSRNVCREVRDAMEHDKRFSKVEKIETALVALLHDVHETIIGDTTRPVLGQYETSCPAFIDVREDLATRIDDSVFRSVGVDGISPEARAIVDKADGHVGKVEGMHIGVIPDNMDDVDRKLTQRIESDRPVHGDDAMRFVEMTNELVKELAVARKRERTRGNAKGAQQATIAP